MSEHWSTQYGDGDYWVVGHNMRIVARTRKPEDCQRIVDDHNSMARLRELLAGLLVDIPCVCSLEASWCFFCFSEGGHNPDCPWLLARQWLEEHPE